MSQLDRQGKQPQTVLRFPSPFSVLRVAVVHVLHEDALRSGLGSLDNSVDFFLRELGKGASSELPGDAEVSPTCVAKVQLHSLLHAPVLSASSNDDCASLSGEAEENLAWLRLVPSTGRDRLGDLVERLLEAGV